MQNNCVKIEYDYESVQDFVVESVEGVLSAYIDIILMD